MLWPREMGAKSSVMAVFSGLRLLRQSRRLLVLGSVLALVGCGHRSNESFTRVAVEGIVDLDGQPLEDGWIRFVPQAGTAGPKTTLRIEQGRFAATARTGPSEGTHRVEIVRADHPDFAHDDEAVIAQLAAQPRRRIALPELPARYNRRSELSVTVEKATANPSQEVVFSLQTK